MLTPPLLLADYAGYVDVSDRSELRLRVTQQLTNPAVAAVMAQGNGGPTQAPVVQPAAGPTPPQVGVDFYTQPQVRLRLTNRSFEYIFAYTPALTVTDLQLGSGAATQFLHIGEVGVAWRASRQVTITVLEDATYGTFNSANILPVGGATFLGAAPTTGGTQPPAPAAGGATPPPAPVTGMNVAPLQAAPAPVTITLVSTRTGANVAVQADQRTRFTVGGGYISGGEIGATPQTVLPLQYGPTANAGLYYALSRRDFSITTAGATSTQFSSLPCISITGAGSPTALCRPLDQVVQLSEGYQHGFERRTALTAQAGIALVRSRNDDSLPYRSVPFPTALLSVVHSEGEQGRFITQAVLQLVPVINPFTGLLTNFIQGEGRLSEPIARTVLFRAVAGGSQAVPTDGPAAATIVEGGFDIDFLVGKQLDLAVGERSFWQRQAVVPVGADANAPAAAFADFFSSVAYFAVTVRAPELRF
jgi:hypothetical protein